MGLGNTGAGFGWTNEYLVSAMPWVTGSVAVADNVAQRINFPKVTKYIKISAVGSPLRIGFTANGITGSNYFRLPANTVETFDVRVSEIYVQGDGGAVTMDIFAGLTLIDKRDGIPYLTGSTANTNAPGSGWPGIG